MRSHLKQIGGFVAVLILGSTLVQAEETGLGGGLKLRAGYGLTQSSDKLDRRTLGFGFEVNYNHPWGRVGVELGYLYKPGNQYLGDVANYPVAAESAPLDPANSADSRKNALSGLTLRASYEKALPASDFSLRAGLQLGSLKYRQEYIADVADTNYNYEDTYNGSVNKSKLSVSPFVGLGYTINEASALELNLVLLGYGSANYVHVAGTVQGSYQGNTGSDSIATSSHYMAHLEIGYTFRF